MKRIFVWCNNCSHEWHSVIAMDEDGRALASHACSSHGFIAHDMGLDEDGLKRDLYDKAHPDGWEIEWVENARPGNHAGLDAACVKNQERAAFDDKAEVKL